MADQRLTTKQAADRLGVTDAYLRSVAQQGRWGAHKREGERGWYFDADEINAEAARRGRVRTAQVTIDPVLDAADPSTWELERQLLIAQAAEAETKAELAQLRAELSARDQQIVALQSELGRARNELSRMAEFVRSAAEEHLH